MSILYSFLTILILIGVWFAFDREQFWERFFGASDLGPVEFKTIARGSKPNEALACPAGYCPNYERAMPAPVFRIGATELMEQVAERFNELERVERMDDGSDPARLRYVARSHLMRYPDTVNIAAIELEPANGQSRSSIAIHSRAKLGYGDQGMNKIRIRQWLAMLDDLTVK